MKTLTKWLPLATALLIAGVLITAAIGKFTHPVEYFPLLDRSISGLELLLLLCILWWCRNSALWLGTALLFALWAGYAFFWHCVKLPCGCMGAKLNIPTAFSISIDLFFLAASLCLAIFLGAKKRSLILCVLISCVLSFGGFAAGKWVFNHYVMTPSQVLPDSASVSS